MARPVLVDSSIYIGLLRRKKDPAVVLKRWAGDRDLATCGMIRVEIIRGLRENQLRTRMEALLDLLLNIPTDNRLWEETADLAWQLDRSGRILPAQDILIAASARRIEAELLTDDHHFDLIPGLRIAGGLDDLLKS